MIKINIETFVPCDINNPDFKTRQRVHCWKNYIPGEFKKIWQELPLITRFCLVIMAEEQASAEEWD